MSLAELSFDIHLSSYVHSFYKDRRAKEDFPLEGEREGFVYKPTSSSRSLDSYHQTAQLSLLPFFHSLKRLLLLYYTKYIHSHLQSAKMQILQLLASAALLAGSVQAHVRLTALNGDTGCVRLPPNNSPVTDVTSNDIVSSYIPPIQSLPVKPIILTISPTRSATSTVPLPPPQSLTSSRAPT